MSHALPLVRPLADAEIERLETLLAELPAADSAMRLDELTMHQHL